MGSKPMKGSQPRNKSVLIRRYFAEHPQSTSSEAAAALQAQGVDVDARYAAQIRSKTRDRALRVTPTDLPDELSAGSSSSAGSIVPTLGAEPGGSWERRLPTAVEPTAPLRPPATPPPTETWKAKSPGRFEDSGWSPTHGLSAGFPPTPPATIDPQAARELLVLAAELIHKAGGPSQAHQAIEAACEVVRRFR